MRPANKISVDETWQLWALLHQTHDVIFKARQQELREARVSVSMIQQAVLWVVEAIDGPATPAEISRWLFREPQTVMVLLLSMQRRGLVRRVRDMDRRNMIRVVLTHKGKAANRDAMASVNMLREIMGSLPAKERLRLRSQLLKLRTQGLETIGSKQTFLYP